MGEIAQIVALWHRAQSHGERVCLATVVHVEGSSYRKPGARMLISAGGERAGTISGGCLEAELSRKIWWLTANGPAVEAYQSSFDEDGGGAAWGLGCGGTVWLLLEQQPDAVLGALEAALTSGTPAVVVAQLTTAIGTRGVFTEASLHRSEQDALHGAAARALAEGRTLTLDAALEELGPGAGATGGRRSGAEAGPAFTELPPYRIEYLAPPPRLSIFGAGDDAQPIARFAEALGWRVTVADGRSHLLRRERFPEAAELRLLAYRSAETAEAALETGLEASREAVSQARPNGDADRNPGSVTGGDADRPANPDPVQRDAPELNRSAKLVEGMPPPAPCGLNGTAARHPSATPQRTTAMPLAQDSIPSVATGVRPGDLAVILTHSFEQDRALLAALLPQPLVYLGILGPRHRTLRLLEEVAPALGWSAQACLDRLHSPVGLDLGARDPAAIALAIVAELQAVLAGRQVEIRHAGSTRSTPESQALHHG